MKKLVILLAILALGALVGGCKPAKSDAVTAFEAASDLVIKGDFGVEKVGADPAASKLLLDKVKSNRELFGNVTATGYTVKSETPTSDGDTVEIVAEQRSQLDFLGTTSAMGSSVCMDEIKATMVKSGEEWRVATYENKGDYFNTCKEMGR